MRKTWNSNELDTLERLYREVYLKNQCTLQEIAEVFNVTCASVKSRIESMGIREERSSIYNEKMFKSLIGRKK